MVGGLTLLEALLPDDLEIGGGKQVAYFAFLDRTS